MGMQNMQNQSMHFVLSTDAKPRLKWTPELHQRFVEATNQLGGPEKATPKSLMRVMGIPGLTLYHLKSHLQKYRLGKSQQLETCSDIKQEDYTEIKSSDGHCSRGICLVDQNQITENLQISQALQMQMEVERKLYEQIEVQKHLEFRIEAQGKYLQSVLKKAHEALAGYNCSPVGIKLTKAELSQLVSIINNACPSSPISELTETRGLSLNYVEGKKDRGTMCSLESSLTSSDSSERNEEKLAIEEIVEFKSSNIVPLELPLMTMHPEEKESNGDSILNNESNERKRNAATKSDDDEHTSKKRCGNKLKKTLDLNCSLNFWNHEDGL